MKRYFSLILIVALLLFSFTACGSDSNITPNSFHSNTPGDNVSGSSSDVISDSKNSTLTEVEFAVTASDMFTKRDKKTEYDNSAVRIQLNGSGSLTITSPAGHGISCKDDLVLAGGTYTITAANHGLDANDSIV